MEIEMTDIILRKKNGFIHFNFVLALGTGGLF